MTPKHPPGPRKKTTTENVPWPPLKWAPPLVRDDELTDA